MNRENYLTKQSVNRIGLMPASRIGLMPASRFKLGRSISMWGYDIHKHGYITARGALKYYWDVYKFPVDDMDDPLQTFKTLKAAKMYVDDMVQTKLEFD